MASYWFSRGPSRSMGQGGLDMLLVLSLHIVLLGLSFELLQQLEGVVALLLFLLFLRGRGRRILLSWCNPLWWSMLKHKT